LNADVRGGSDKMSHDKHNPNVELMAQGVANILSPLWRIAGNRGDRTHRDQRPRRRQRLQWRE